VADIFISYSRADEVFVKRLYSELRRFNVRGFRDATDLAAGASLSRQLKESIENADAVLVVLSKDAVHSSWVMAEVGLAQSLKKAVIPVLAPGQSYDESVPPQLVDRLVLEAGKLPIEEVAARAVAAATGTSVESALNEVESRFRRRQRVLYATAASFALLAVIAVSMAIAAAHQRNAAAVAYREAVHQRDAAESARREAEVSRKRIEELTGQSASLALAPDGRTLAVGGRDGSVRLRNLSSGRTVRVLSGNGGTISGLAYSPDGRLLASASWDGSLQLWEVGTGRVLSQMRGQGDAVIGLQFAADGRLLYSRSVDGTIREWNVQSGEVRKVFQTPE
jgi:hypothetical protein